MGYETCSSRFKSFQFRASFEKVETQNISVFFIASIESLTVDIDIILNQVYLCILKIHFSFVEISFPAPHGWPRDENTLP